MTDTAHARSINASEKTTRELKALFGKLGTKENPRGRIVSAYRVARKAIKPELEAGNIRAAQDILIELNISVQAAATLILQEAAILGLSQAETEAEIYALDTTPSIDPVTIALGVNAISAQVDLQTQKTLSTLATGGDPTLIIGDASRVGLLSPAVVVKEAANWITNIAMLTTIGAMLAPSAESEFMRQAIAAIDERTTDCCLRVHGQAQPIGKQFELSGTPRYADKMMHSPFHGYCRTSIALVSVKDAKDDLTGMMKSAARSELNARKATGTLVEIHPSDAFSGR